jgi:hypothetical protein
MKQMVNMYKLEERDHWANLHADGGVDIKETCYVIVDSVV